MGRSEEPIRRHRLAIVTPRRRRESRRTRVPTVVRVRNRVAPVGSPLEGRSPMKVFAILSALVIVVAVSAVIYLK